MARPLESTATLRLNVRGPKTTLYATKSIGQSMKRGQGSCVAAADVERGFDELGEENPYSA